MRRLEDDRLHQGFTRFAKREWKLSVLARCLPIPVGASQLSAIARPTCVRVQRPSVPAPAGRQHPRCRHTH
jgi:hypothetical protein